MLAADASSAPERDRTAPPLSTRQDALVDALTAIVRLKAAEGQVSAASLANRSELERLVRGERELEVLKDWRLKLAGQALLEFLAGDSVLAAGEGGLDVRSS